MKQCIKDKLDQILEYSNSSPDVMLDDIFTKDISRGSLFRDGKKRIVGFCAKYPKNEAINMIKNEYGLGGGTIHNVCLDEASNLRFVSDGSSDSKGIKVYFSLLSASDEISNYFYSNLKLDKSSIIKNEWIDWHGFSKVYSWNEVYNEIKRQIECESYMNRMEVEQICDYLGVKNPFSFNEEIEVQLSLFDLFEDEKETDVKPTLNDILKSIDVERKKFVTSHDSDCHGKNKLKEIER